MQTITTTSTNTIRPAARRARVRPALPTVAILCLALGACSGGDGGGTAHEIGPGTGVGEPAAALPANPYVAGAAEAAEASAPRTVSAALTVAPEFDLRTRRDVPLTIDVPEARGRTGYLSLCLEWEDGDAAGESSAPVIDYGSCVLRATIEDGRLQAELPLANRQASVLAVVWFADPGAAPAYREIRLDGA